MTFLNPKHLCDTDANHIYTYAFVEGCKDLTPPHWPRPLAHTNSHTLWASCLSGGPTEQMDRDAALYQVISIPPEGPKKLRVRERWSGPERKALLTAAHSVAFTITYQHLPPNEGRPEPHWERECVSLYMLLSL